MEIVKNRSGLERVYEKISPTKIRVMGESLYVRQSVDNGGNLTMYDFEGGPALNVGGKVEFMKSFWVIESIKVEDTGQENLHSVLITVRHDF
jgi:hypothetical protein